MHHSRNDMRFWVLSTGLAKLVLTFSSVLGFSVWPEACGRQLWSQRPHLLALWFDHRDRDKDTAWLLALPLLLWRESPVSLSIISPGGASLPTLLRPLPQVAPSFMSSLIFPPLLATEIHRAGRKHRQGGFGLWASNSFRGAIPSWIPANLHIKASLSFSSAQENIWKIYPVNSSLCSCLDFNIYLPIQHDICCMPMGRKIRHYEKQKAFPLSFFLFFPNRFTSMKKNLREIWQIAQCLFKRRGVIPQNYSRSGV